MVAGGEAALASDYRGQLGLPESALDIDPEAIAAAEAKRAEAYLGLGLPEGAVVVLDDPGQLPAARAALEAAPAVGIDVEWQPSHQAGRQTPAALLQVRAAGGRASGRRAGPRPLGRTASPCAAAVAPFLN
jgi:hypothetical protein